MKYLVALLALVAVVAVMAGNFGNVDSTQTTDQRSRNMIMLSTLVGPYTWMDTVNVAAANYGVPDSIKVCEVRFLKPGTYKIKLKRSGARPYIADSCDILRLDLDTIYTSGTFAGGQTGSIRLFGLRK